MATDPSHPHDALFRAAFTAPDQAAELLCAFLPQALVDAIDWQALEHVPASFVDGELRDHHADLLFRTVADGRRVLVYLLLEHKSADDRWTALQLLRYVVRIWERCRREVPGEGLRLALRTQIEVRFGAVDPATAARIEQADVAALEALLRRMLDADSLADLFAG